MNGIQDGSITFSNG
jgi:hypothetical protein